MLLCAHKRPRPFRKVIFPAEFSDDPIPWRPEYPEQKRFNILDVFRLANPVEGERVPLTFVAIPKRMPSKPASQASL